MSKPWSLLAFLLANGAFAQDRLAVANADFDAGLTGWNGIERHADKITVDWDAQVGDPEPGSMRIVGREGFRLSHIRSQCVVPPPGTMSLVVRARVFADLERGACYAIAAPNEGENCSGADAILGGGLPVPPESMVNGWSEVETVSQVSAPSYRVALVVGGIIGQCNFDNIRVTATLSAAPLSDPVPVPAMSLLAKLLLTLLVGSGGLRLSRMRRSSV